MKERVIEKIIPIIEYRTQIITDVKISRPDKTQTILAKALWDTGTTYSSITNRVAEVLSLTEVRKVKTLNTTGEHEENSYSAILHLEELSWSCEYDMIPSNAFIEGQNHNVLIGMDIISTGNFSLVRISENQLLFKFSF